MANTLTKEILKNYGITEVKKTGQVFRNGKLVRERTLVRKHPYGKTTVYMGIQFYDQNRPYKEYKVKYNTKQGVKTRIAKIRPVVTFPLARVVLAWFNGVIESNMDADHIDGDPYNNHLSNLRAVTRKENLLNRAKTQREIINEYWKLKREKEQEEARSDNKV